MQEGTYFRERMSIFFPPALYIAAVDPVAVDILRNIVWYIIVILTALMEARAILKLLTKFRWTRR